MSSFSLRLVVQFQSNQNLLKILVPTQSKSCQRINFQDFDLPNLADEAIETDVLFQQSILNKNKNQSKEKYNKLVRSSIQIPCESVEVANLNIHRCLLL